METASVLCYISSAATLFFSLYCFFISMGTASDTSMVTGCVLLFVTSFALAGIGITLHSIARSNKKKHADQNDLEGAAEDDTDLEKDENPVSGEEQPSQDARQSIAQENSEHESKNFRGSEKAIRKERTIRIRTLKTWFIILFVLGGVTAFFGVCFLFVDLGPAIVMLLIGGVFLGIGFYLRHKYKIKAEERAEEKRELEDIAKVEQYKTQLFIEYSELAEQTIEYVESKSDWEVSPITKKKVVADVQKFAYFDIEKSHFSFFQKQNVFCTSSEQDFVAFIIAVFSFHQTGFGDYVEANLHDTVQLDSLKNEYFCFMRVIPKDYSESIVEKRIEQLLKKYGIYSADWEQSSTPIE